MLLLRKYAYKHGIKISNPFTRKKKTVKVRRKNKRYQQGRYKRSSMHS